MIAMNKDGRLDVCHEDRNAQNVVNNASKLLGLARLA